MMRILATAGLSPTAVIQSKRRGGSNGKATF
jgi:hypothetical protein